MQAILEKLHIGEAAKGILQVRLKKLHANEVVRPSYRC